MDAREIEFRHECEEAQQGIRDIHNTENEPHPGCGFSETVWLTRKYPGIADFFRWFAENEGRFSEAVQVEVYRLEQAFVDGVISDSDIKCFEDYFVKYKKETGRL